MTVERNNMVAFLEKYKLGPINNEEYNKDLEMIQLKHKNLYPQHPYENVRLYPQDNIPYNYPHQIHEEIINHPKDENFGNKLPNE